MTKRRKVNAVRVAAMAASFFLIGSAPPDDFPRAPMTLDGTSGQIELHFIGDVAALTFRASDGTVKPLRIIDTPDDTLSVLADPRLSFAEPALLAWAGNDLALQRDRMIARANAAIEISLPTLSPKSAAERWSGGEKLTATLQYLRVLRAVGKTDEAIAYLRSLLAKFQPGSPPSDDHMRLTVRLANILFEDSREEEGIALLDAESKALPEKSDSRANLDINLAALLARSGHFQRALVLVDATWRSFMGSNPDDVYDGSIKVPGSEAQFAWIRACSLNGLGQKDKARAIMTAILDTPPDTPGEPAPTVYARLQGYQCMKDPNGLAREFAAQVAVADPGSSILLALDPLNDDYAPERDNLKAALRLPVLAGAMRGRVRSLARFAPAVAHWR